MDKEELLEEMTLHVQRFNNWLQDEMEEANVIKDQQLLILKNPKASKIDKEIADTEWKLAVSRYHTIMGIKEHFQWICLKLGVKF